MCNICIYYVFNLPRINKELLLLLDFKVSKKIFQRLISCFSIIIKRQNKFRYLKLQCPSAWICLLNVYQSRTLWDCINRIRTVSVLCNLSQQMQPKNY